MSSIEARAAEEPQAPAEDAPAPPAVVIIGYGPAGREVSAALRDNGLGVTVYFGHRKGSASTSDLSPEAIRVTVRAACNIARYTMEDPCAGLADPDLMATRIPDLDLYHPWELNIDEALEIYQKARIERTTFVMQQSLKRATILLSSDPDDQVAVQADAADRLAEADDIFLFRYFSHRHIQQLVL